MKAINSVLADGLAALNAVLAIVVVIAGILGGSAGFQAEGYGELTGAIMGGAAGLLVAIFICGALALAVDIRANLVSIRELLANRS
jgi:hypothetical protein